MKLIIMQFPVSLCKPNALHSTPFLNILIFSPLMRDQTSHPYKTTGRIIVCNLNYPKRNKLHLEHGESLKTRIIAVNVSSIEHGKTTDSG